MQKKEKRIKVLIEGGKATPGPPVGPALGPTGVRVDLVVKEINEKTKEYQGYKVPVYIYVDLDTKKWRVETGLPPTSVLIKMKLGKQGKSKEKNISFNEIINIAKKKITDMNVKSLEGAVKTVLGTCVSMNVMVDGRNPREVLKEISEGKLQQIIK